MNSRSAVLIALALSAWSGAIIGAIFAAVVTLAICCSSALVIAARISLSGDGADDEQQGQDYDHDRYGP